MVSPGFGLLSPFASLSSPQTNVPVTASVRQVIPILRQIPANVFVFIFVPPSAVGTLNFFSACRLSHRTESRFGKSLSMVGLSAGFADCSRHPDAVGYQYRREVLPRIQPRQAARSKIRGSRSEPAPDTSARQLKVSLFQAQKEEPDRSCPKTSPPLEPLNHRRIIHGVNRPFPRSGASLPSCLFGVRSGMGTGVRGYM